MTKKFVNALIPVHHPDHARAVLNEAERLGYVWNKGCLALELNKFKTTCCIHLRADGTVFAYSYFTASELMYNAPPHDVDFGDVVILNKLRKLRGLDAELNNPTVVSQDNLAVLTVTPRPKYDVVVAPYDSNNFPECTCLGVDVNTRKTCRMVKAYGGTCGKPFAKLQKATQEERDKTIKWVRPKAENPIVTTVVRWLAVQGERVARVLKSGFLISCVVVNND